MIVQSLACTLVPGMRKCVLRAPHARYSRLEYAHWNWNMHTITVEDLLCNPLQARHHYKQQKAGQALSTVYVELLHAPLAAVDESHAPSIRNKMAEQNRSSYAFLGFGDTTNQLTQGTSCRFVEDTKVVATIKSRLHSSQICLLPTVARPQRRRGGIRYEVCPKSNIPHNKGCPQKEAVAHFKFQILVRVARSAYDSAAQPNSL